MAKQTSMNQERSAFRNTRLSSAMRDLLGAVMRAFDSRRLMLEAASVGENDYHPETCQTCDGTGFVLILDVPEVEVSDSSDDEGPQIKEEDIDPAGLLPSDSRVSPPAGATGASGTSALLAGGATTSVPIVPAPATAIPQLAPLGTLAGMSLPVVPVVPSGPQITPASAAAPLVSPAAAVGIPANVAPSPTYTISTIIPGFESLGPNSSNPQPPPAPANAVFTGPEERYYVITKGTRVGIFGGWQSTSPYVTGVASASFSRHRTIQTAFQAYETAYNRGSVVAYLLYPRGP
ncbi:hypothetical protein DFP72DRAFT_851588 [Ephemerocybe angulata]|uniref:Ribonuclease H1 N-terminal domain-containing protein n=1 Tax=Ephemerocybe angulata TaxID=980116 RepID=A0A8H6M261_9AGAR|nr:hypothetical protein DFP72DRAFT_851588 [Tulosesus angulatus]